MGLDTSHNAFHGPYSWFHDKRKQLANHLGFNLMEMEGFGGIKEWSGKDDVEILLTHSDCDGIISSEDCGRLAKRLDEILLTIPFSSEYSSLYYFVKTFSEGCKLANSKNEEIDFH